MTTIEIIARALEDDATLVITSHGAADGAARRKDAEIGSVSGALVTMADDEILVIRKVKRAAAPVGA